LIRIKYIILALIFYSIILHLGPKSPQIKPGIHPELEVHINEFIYQAKKFRPDWEIPNINMDLLDMSFLDLFNERNSYIIGVCNILSKKMIINISFFRFANHTLQEQVIFHELGHCLLGRYRHINDNINTIPISLMNSYLFSSYIYEAYREYYIAELFLGEEVRGNPADYIK
jgi:hypothetical protein